MLRATFSALPHATNELAIFAEPFVAAAFGGSPGIRLALQEITNDLYDGFLSKEERVKRLTRDGVFPELHKVPHAPTIVLDAEPKELLPHYVRRKNTIHFPVWLAQPDGVLAWITLAHETAGHAVLAAYGLGKKLEREIGEKLRDLKDAELWMGWFEEAASDCLAVLNLGPAMTLGSIASWRAWGQLTRGAARLPSESLEDPKTHPPPALRAYLMAHVTGKLGYVGAKDAGDALKDEVRREFEDSKQGLHLLDGAEIFADLLVAGEQEALRGYSFLKLQNWSDGDEKIARELGDVLLDDAIPSGFDPEHFAAHALAAAITESLKPSRGRGERVVRNLIQLLKLMHDSERSQKSRAELQLPDLHARRARGVSMSASRLEASKHRRSSKKGVRMATGKKKAKKKASILKGGISEAEAKQIVAKVPVSVRKRLKKYW
jgi:hypothetical protein